ncbi:hypothetical protein K440DRAFT_663103 [Wilcoxina mikolae CBS 423.85]|nr:hypothetical protein K440DRAFT_663103 [Wilcoxina mikolae CBS 423.85]
MTTTFGRPRTLCAKLKPLAYRYIEEIRLPCGEIVFIHRDYNERNEVLDKFAELGSGSLDQETTESTSLALEYPFVVTKFTDADGEKCVQVFFHDSSLLEDITCNERGCRYDRGSFKTTVKKIDGAWLWEIARLKWGFFVHPGRMNAKLRLLVFGFLQNVEIVSGVPLGSGLADFVSLAFLRALALPNAHLPLVGFSLDSVSTHRGGVPGDLEMLKNLFRLLFEFQVSFESSSWRGIELVKIGRRLGLSKIELPEWINTSGFPWETPELAPPRSIHRSPSPARAGFPGFNMIQSFPQQILQQPPPVRSTSLLLEPLTPASSSYPKHHDLANTELLEADFMEIDLNEDTHAQVFSYAPCYISQVNTLSTDGDYDMVEEHNEQQSTGPLLPAEQYPYCGAIFEPSVPLPSFSESDIIAHSMGVTTNFVPSEKPPPGTIIQHLQRPRRRSRTDTPSRYSCHNCGAQFTNIGNYNRHKSTSKCGSGVARVNGQLGISHKFCCAQCGKAYNRKDNLGKHWREKHKVGRLIDGWL